MLGALVGDMAGSRFEKLYAVTDRGLHLKDDTVNRFKKKEFRLFTIFSGPTDDSIMTLAVARTFLKWDGNIEHLGDEAVRCMQELYHRYPHKLYGRRFKKWLEAANPEPYGSYGNGGAMRVSPCAYAAPTLEDAKKYANIVTGVSHDDPKALKGAEAVTVAIYKGLHGASLGEGRAFINAEYYPMNFTLEDARAKNRFDESAEGTVPLALMAVWESTSFEDAVRNAVSLGGDADTLAAIAGAVAEAYYGGIPDKIRHEARKHLDEYQKGIVDQFERKYSVAGTQ